MPEHAELTKPITGAYILDEDHTTLGFVVRHAWVNSVEGRFKRFKGDAYLDPDAPQRSTADVEIETASLTTDNELRDARLLATGFLDHVNHPRISFTSTRVEPIDAVSWRMTGDLTIAGVRRPVSVEFTFVGMVTEVAGGLMAQFHGQASIRRSDWGIVLPSGLEQWRMVSDRVRLTLAVLARPDG